METMLSSVVILDRLGHEELQLKQLGMVHQAAGVRTAIVAVLKLLSEHHDDDPPSLEPSS